MPLLLDGATGMSAMVGALTDSSTGITSQALWTEATNAVPLIVTVFIFAFGYRIIRRVVGGGYKGKVKC